MPSMLSLLRTGWLRYLGWDPIARAEQLLKASQAKIQHSQMGGAYYRVSSDTIQLPARERFENAGGYYSTALHELGHNADSRIMPRRTLDIHESRVNPTRLLGII